jgi:hypothetical protein
LALQSLEALLSAVVPLYHGQTQLVQHQKAWVAVTWVGAKVHYSVGSNWLHLLELLVSIVCLLQMEQLQMVLVPVKEQLMRVQEQHAGLQSVAPVSKQPYRWLVP